MKVTELRRLTLREIARRIRTRETSSSEIVSLLVKRIRDTDNKVRAYITVCAEDAHEAAHAADLEMKSGLNRGPLHGIPLSFKDIFETRGIRTTCGSRLMKNYVPRSDGTVVKRLKSVGAIVLGKLNTHEFALGATTPPTRNPWNLERIPGGSSGGSGAAVAASSAIAATGTDTAGSIRLPASFCGVVGLKPTYGRVSRKGVIPASWSLDHVGTITKRVEDAALLLSIIAGRDDLDPVSSEVPVPDYEQALKTGISGLRVGVPKNYFFDRCDKSIVKAVSSAIDLLEELGCKIVEFRFPHTSELMASCIVIDACEGSAYHEKWLDERAEDYMPDSRRTLEAGLFIPATYYIQGMRTRAMVLPKILKLFKRFDVIVTPTAPLVAPEFNAPYKLGSVIPYTAPFNVLGLPALSVPCGFTHGLPIGMQIVGNLFDEPTVLRFGHAYEQATKWHLQWPAIS